MAKPSKHISYSKYLPPYWIFAVLISLAIVPLIVISVFLGTYEFFLKHSPEQQQFAKVCESLNGAPYTFEKVSELKGTCLEFQGTPADPGNGYGPCTPEHLTPAKNMSIGYDVYISSSGMGDGWRCGIQNKEGVIKATLNWYTD